MADIELGPITDEFGNPIDVPTGGLSAAPTAAQSAVQEAVATTAPAVPDTQASAGDTGQLVDPALLSQLAAPSPAERQLGLSDGALLAPAAGPAPTDDFTLEQLLQVANQPPRGRGGPRRTTEAVTTRQLQAPISPAISQQVVAAQDRLANLSQQAADARQAEANQRAAIMNDAAGKLAGIETERQQRTQSTQAKIDQQLDTIKELEDSMSSGKITSFLEKSAGARIGAGIAAALGAFGATLGRTRNFALDQINAAIDRDIQAQRQARADKRGQIKARAGLVQLYRNALGDEQAAADFAKASMLKETSLRLDKMAQQIQGTQAQENAMLLQAELDAARAQALQDGAMKLAGSTVITERTKRVQGGGRGGRRLTLKDIKDAQSILKSQAELKRASSTSGVDPKALQQLGDRLRKHGIPEADSAIGEAESLLGDAGMLETTAGRLLARTPLVRALAPERAKRMNAAFLNVADLVLRSRTGAAAPIEEKRDMAQQLGLRLDATPTEIRNGLQRAREISEANARNIFQATPKAVVDALLGAKQQAQEQVQQFRGQTGSLRRE